MRKPDPELLPIQRPRCPTCQARMLILGVEDAPDGFESRTFRCRKCHRTETRLPGSRPDEDGRGGMAF
jgi:tRNA(Ile2) C34 agmatinyltransferase TiaS